MVAGLEHTQRAAIAMPRSELLQTILDSIPADFADPAADYHAVRRMFAPFHSHPISDRLEVEIVEYGGVRCGRYTWDNHASATVALHCHGGGLVSTTLDEYHFYAGYIAQHTGTTVVMPDYRLAPEHPYPAAHNDCFNAYRGLLASGLEAGNISVMGESCGGGLGMGILLRARDENVPLPASFVSLTGWFDISCANTTREDDPFLTPEWVRNRGRDYIADQFSLDDPRVSPAYADLSGLPPLYLQLGECDTMREGCLTMASNALRSGVEVTLEGWPGMTQGWHGLVGSRVPEAEEAWRRISEFLDRVHTRA